MLFLSVAVLTTLCHRLTTKIYYYRANYQTIKSRQNLIIYIEKYVERES